ncbi:hypothetical protein DFJ58DRAFT_847833 [Suillus subalutaceus]|uniref:uncharacterized protein n=1 Tax=Suillus subalutaceus TaxID=48586 RepID=UPI001B873BAC|nr:uncharacterized protein DFJ58DRAFT_847833 [Suillus subalutaceus]KAG1833294.1 hypothetical protein DFJ58DRAFT_847833 [Suillus subalutaceus]
MDFARLDSVLSRIALQHGISEETLLAEWLERREVTDSEHWKQLNGIPCIIGGLNALLGMLEGCGGTFPWKTLPTILARRGCTLHHYPKNVLMPGKKRPMLARSKGIHNLTLHEQDLLADALRTNSITIQHITNNNSRRKIQISREPIIFGEAPEYDSPDLHGRRGLARLMMVETSSEPSLVLSPPAPSRRLPPEPSLVLSPLAPSRRLRRWIPRLMRAETSPEPPSEPSLVLSPPVPFHRLCQQKLRVLSPEDSPVVSPVPSCHRKHQVFVELPLAPSLLEVESDTVALLFASTADDTEEEEVDGLLSQLLGL